MKTLNTKYPSAQAGQILNSRVLLLATLFLIAFAERVFFDFGPNFELVTTVLVLSSFYFGRKQSFWTVFLIMLLSDLIIGNTNIFLFTWTGFLIPTLVLPKLFRSSKWLTSSFDSVTEIRNLFTETTTLTGTGLLSNLFFYIHTNFGVWLLSGMYPKTAVGLLMSYINALPFLKYQLISTLIFIPTALFLIEFAVFILKKYQKDNSLTSSKYRHYKFF